MIEGIIRQTIRRSNRTILTLNILGMLVIAGLVALNARYLDNFLRGPAPISAEEITAYTSAGQPRQYWLTVTGDEVFDTGMQYVNEKNGQETVEFSYLALPQNDRLLLVKVPGEAVEQTTFTGWLVDLTNEEQKEVIDSLVAEYPDLAGVFLPFGLETGDFRVGGIIGILVGLAALIGTTIGLVKGIRRSSDAGNHPILQRLARFGATDFVVNQIENELAGQHTSFGNTHLTPHWLVYAVSTDLRATRFEEIAWIYMHVTTQRTYGITVSRQYMIVVIDRNNDQISILTGMKEDQTLEVLRAILERAPWALAGYSDELKKAWKKDRQGFLAEVERRKKAGPDLNPTDQINNVIQSI